MPLHIANAAGFLGDNIDAPRRLIETAQVDYLTLEYLAELTMSILARVRESKPTLGYAGDFLDVLASLLPLWPAQPQLRIVTNAGGVNPLACVQAAAKQLVAAGQGDKRIGLVSGDDLLVTGLDRLLAAGCSLANFDSSAAWSTQTRPVKCANAYLGAQPIAAALDQGAQLVITGRVADASLTVGPAMHTFRGDWHDWHTLAGYSVAGHLIECGAQVTGGYATDWSNYSLADVGYPIAELEADGSCVITKPAGSGGAVTRQTVIEQLTYEIGDPQRYFTPDVVVDFTTVQVEDLGLDRVRVTHASGAPATSTYKVSLAYEDGWMSAGELLVYGDDAVAKAQRCAELIFARLASVGYRYDRSHVELLGAGAAAGQAPREQAREVMLRVAVHDLNRAAVERFTKEFAPLITSGPAGLAGYAAGRPSVRPVFAYWPTLVEKSLVTPQVEVRAAKDWVG